MADTFANIARSPVFNPDKKAFIFWSQDEQEPVHASYLTATGQQQEHDRRRLARLLGPSGFIHVGDRTIKARGDTDLVPGDLVCGVTGNDANTFHIYAPEPYRVLVDGHVVVLYHVLGMQGG